MTEIDEVPPRPAMPQSRSASLEACPCCAEYPRLLGRFCTNCGEIKVCPQCAEPRSSSARFCRKCGLDLSALRHGPKPEGPVGTFNFVASPFEFRYEEEPEALQRTLADFVSQRRVDSHRAACGQELLNAIGSPDALERASLRVDFRPYRALPRTVIQWPGTPAMAVLRHAWLTFSVPFLDGTELRLTIVDSIREALVELPAKGRKKPRLQRMEQLSGLLLFSLQTQDAAPLKPSSDGELRKRLAADEQLRRIQVRPDTATLEYEYGPLYLFQGGLRDNVYRGYGVEKRLTPTALGKTVQDAYRALLDITDGRVL